MSTDNQRSRQDILESVRSPLGFYTLIALIADGLVSGGALTGKLPWLAPVGLLLVVLAVFTAVVFFRSDALYPPAPKTPVTVSLKFPDATDIQLDLEKCFLEVRDGQNKLRGSKSRPANLTQDELRIWTVRLGSDILPSDSVSLELQEENGQRWKVTRFFPYVTARTPTKVLGSPIP